MEPKELIAGLLENKLTAQELVSTYNQVEFEGESSCIFTDEAIDLWVNTSRFIADKLKELSEEDFIGALAASMANALVAGMVLNEARRSGVAINLRSSEPLEEYKL